MILIQRHGSDVNLKWYLKYDEFILLQATTSEWIVPLLLEEMMFLLPFFDLHSNTTQNLSISYLPSPISPISISPTGDSGSISAQLCTGKVMEAGLGISSLWYRKWAISPPFLTVSGVLGRAFSVRTKSCSGTLILGSHFCEDCLSACAGTAPCREHSSVFHLKSFFVCFLSFLKEMYWNEQNPHKRVEYLLQTLKADNIREWKIIMKISAERKKKILRLV